MPLKSKASNKTGGGEQCPPGMWPGACVAVLDLGTHLESYQGGPEKKVRKAVLVWEVEAEHKGKDARFYLPREYSIGLDDAGNLQMGLKNGLRQMLEAWRNKPYADGEDIDPEAALGRACQVNVAHRQSGQASYAEIKAIAPLAKGQTPLKPEVKPLSYSADSEDAFADPAWLPWVFGFKVGALIENSLERKGTGRRDDLRKKKPQLPGQEGGTAPPEDEGGGYTQADEIPF